MKKYCFFLSLVFLLTLSNCKKMNEIMVIGHRGAMGHETENTLASVQKALDLGVDMIEIDVFKVKSGEIVVFHDETLERLSNAGGRIEDYNIFDLKKVILEGNHKIPMLQDVLRLIDHKVSLNIELKGAGTADRVNFIVEYYIKEKGWKIEDFLISSFNWDELRDMRKINKNIAIAILSDGNPIEAIPMAKELGAIAINPDYKMLNSENVEEIKDGGFKIYTYTVNEPKDIEKMKDLGVNGIFTNFPERIR
ncbi:glycerophosphodiester phosphodiesterase [Sediminicola arcticus]|jgi:glycerophosphoryl diester phosphodiesterase|uniref:Glycerophosphodiester phosphodiesterase family protein n=1 Tax=Sediminicola arcticus TaxID=1574308 RepID=A0ABV2SXV3_9FLAO